MSRTVETEPPICEFCGGYIREDEQPYPARDGGGVTHDVRPVPGTQAGCVHRPQCQTSLGDGEYAGLEDANLDIFEVNDVIEVLDWNQEGEETDESDDEETSVRYPEPPEPVVDEDGTVSILYPADEHTDINGVQPGTLVCK